MATAQQIQTALQRAQAAGNADDVAQLQAALAQTQKPQGPTREQLSQAFYAAHRAGNEDDARQIIGYIQQHGMTLAPMNAQQADAAFQKQNAQNVAAQPWYKTALQGSGKSFIDTGRGIGELIGVESPQDVENARRADHALMDTTAGKIGDYGTQALQMYALGGALGTAAKGLSLGGRLVPYVTSALAGGALSGTQPITQDESRGLHALSGAAFGAAGEAVPGILGASARKVSPSISAAKQAGIDLAQRYGIPLHLSQVTDSKFLQTLGSASKYLPFSGNQSAKAAQQGAFNRALSNQIGEDVPALTDDVLSSAAQRIGQGYSGLFARTNVQIQPQTVQKLGALWRQANQDLPPDLGRVVHNQIAKYFDAAQANGGTIPGRLYQNIRSSLQQIENGNSPSAHLIGQVRKAMQDAAEGSMGPADAATLKSLNGQYNSLKTLQKAIGKRVAGASGDVAPSSLWSLVNGRYGSTPEMRDLAKLGQNVLKDPIPDSGTPGRLISYGALTGGAAMPHTVAPLALAGATVGRVLNSPVAARALPYAGQNLLLGLSRAARPAPYLLPLLSAQASAAVPVRSQ